MILSCNDATLMGPFHFCMFSLIKFAGKKKVKLLNGLSKDLITFSDIGFSLGAGNPKLKTLNKLIFSYSYAFIS